MKQKLWKISRCASGSSNVGGGSTGNTGDINDIPDGGSTSGTGGGIPDYGGEDPTGNEDVASGNSGSNSSSGCFRLVSLDSETGMIYEKLVGDCNDQTGQNKSITAKKSNDLEKDECLGCPEVVDGGVGVNSSTTAQKINGILGNTLNNDQLNWLSNNSEEESKILKFLAQNNTVKGREYIELMIEAKRTNDYLQLFASSIFNQPDPYKVWKKITQAERDLIKSDPISAYIIYNNRPIAEDATFDRFSFNGLNDKSDSFRHAYFNALNAKVVGIVIAKLFSDAHESEVHISLTLEKDMDLFNNNIGHQTAINNLEFSLEDLSNEIFNDLNTGELRYLSPLNFISSPRFDNDGDGVQDCSNCRNGIISITQLIPTNQ